MVRGPEEELGNTQHIGWTEPTDTHWLERTNTYTLAGQKQQIHIGWTEATNTHRLDRTKKYTLAEQKQQIRIGWN